MSDCSRCTYRSHPNETRTSRRRLLPLIDQDGSHQVCDWCCIKMLDRGTVALVAVDDARVTR